MKDDELLRNLAEAARRDPDRARARRWERLASGEASEEERRALEAIAADEGEPDAMAAMAPMGDAIAARVMARLAADAKPAAAPEEKTTEPKGLAKVTRLPRAAAIAGVVAMAAGVALVAMRALTPAAPLPAYAMAVTGGLRDTRGGPAPAAAPIRLGGDSQLSIVLRPARDVTTALDVRAAIVRGDHAEAWTPPVTVSPTGVVSIAGAAASIVPGPAGPCDLVVVVGPRGAVPVDATAIAAATSDEHLAVGRAHVELVDR